LEINLPRVPNPYIDGITSGIHPDYLLCTGDLKLIHPWLEGIEVEHIIFTF